VQGEQEADGGHAVVERFAPRGEHADCPSIERVGVATAVVWIDELGRRNTSDLLRGFEETEIGIGPHA
jgi:hypothetical protein